MLKKNVELVLRQIAPSDLVLDIGGWAQPFNRANYVIDIMPYETRGIFGYTGPGREFFSKETWIIHDVSSKTPLPFDDKEIDFVICSHVLEDIRDPIYLCSEIVRIGKKGYIEVPSRTVESIMGLEKPHYAGYYHHRWLIEIKGSEIIFRFKPHLIHSSWKYHFPKSYLKKLSEEERVSYLFWKDTFQYKEVIQISALKIAKELEEFIRSKKVYPSLFYTLDSVWNGTRPKEIVKSILKTLKKSPRLKAIIQRISGRKIIYKDSDSFWLNIPEVYSR
jgi:hypothetical protein